jgi:hypothetical protein
MDIVTNRTIKLEFVDKCGKSSILYFDAFDVLLSANSAEYDARVVSEKEMKAIKIITGKYIDKINSIKNIYLITFKNDSDFFRFNASSELVSCYFDARNNSKNRSLIGFSFMVKEIPIVEKINNKIVVGGYMGFSKFCFW